jgi:hypothetical protein
MESECCNGTGLADYAAVPCPNPRCPVLKEMENNNREAERRCNQEEDE